MILYRFLTGSNDLADPLLLRIKLVFSSMHRGEFDLEFTSELIERNDPHLDPFNDPSVDEIGVSKLYSPDFNASCITLSKLSGTN